MQIVIDIPEDRYNEIWEVGFIPDDYFYRNIIKVIKNGTPLPKGHGRKFEEIVVEYPPADLCTYPEYRGKPYFSIKYEENGEHFIGFGTYNPWVFSRYLQEYFITPTIIEADEESKGRK